MNVAVLGFFSDLYIWQLKLKKVYLISSATTNHLPWQSAIVLPRQVGTDEKDYG